MDASVSNAVSTSLYMNQAQSAQQAQMQVFKEALDNQEQQVSALMESATAGSGSDQGSSLASEGNLGTQVNTYA
ncbi:putative motility protein [Halomonas vilamensis]|uniref:Motility protein n=1 Tax=Vreelandella vilamensis TaxID=531309 RepID=A0ABU1H1P9_9GAMM|nr:putative motility protein [Halomonas vilamensis]MDR5898231.1 putative motility protein [Halomonas vilamensis]